jgi:hypothetical protein
MITKYVKVPIYQNALHIVITNNYMEDLAQINKKYFNEFTKEHDVLGQNQQRGGSTLIIINAGKHKKIFKKDWEIELIATIAHEAFHATNTMMNSFGARPDAMNDEPQAYLLDWIVKEIYKCYLKSK